MNSPHLPRIVSVADLSGFANAMIRGAVQRYQSLAKEMRRTHNPETAVLFDRLATLEQGRISEIRIENDVERQRLEEEGDRWKHFLNNDTQAQEIEENLFLMTPYRALRYAVYNGERLFGLLSAIAAEAGDSAVRNEAEGMAQVELGHIAEMRLMRRRAYRTEVVAAIGRAGLNREPADYQALLPALGAINQVLEPLIESILQRWSTDLPGETKAALETISAGLRGSMEPDISAAGHAIALEMGNSQLMKEPESAYEALKTLLRETEASFDLLMDMAETSQSEEVLSACQTTAQQFIRYLTLVREQLSLLNQIREGAI